MSKGGRPKRYTAKQVIAAIRKTRGRVHLAADILRCDSETIQNYAKRYSEVRRTINSERDKRLDRTENKLDDAVDAGEGWAICFLLKTQGKHRGYIERQETSFIGDAVKVQVIDDPNWYRRTYSDDHATACNGTPSTDLIESGKAQGSSSGQAVRQNGLGPAGLRKRPRP